MQVDLPRDFRDRGLHAGRIKRVDVEMQLPSRCSAPNERRWIVAPVLPAAPTAASPRRAAPIRVTRPAGIAADIARSGASGCKCGFSQAVFEPDDVLTGAL